MQNLKNVKLKGVKFFTSKQYFNLFKKIFYNIENDITIKTLFQVPNKVLIDESFPRLTETSTQIEEKENKWKKIANEIEKEIYLDISGNIQKSKIDSEYILTSLSFKYIKSFCHEVYNKLRQLSKINKINIKTLKKLYINLCIKNNNKTKPNFRSRNRKSSLENQPLSQENNKNINQIEINTENEQKYKNRASLFITEKFTSIFYKRDSLKLKHKRASILEKYNAIKNVKEDEEKENEEEQANKFELNYLTRNTLPIGHITNKFIGPTDEKSILNKHRKLLINFKLRENALNYLKEKKLNSNKLKTPLIEEKKVNEKISKSEFKVKNNNNFNFPSLNTCGSSNSLKVFNQKKNINTLSGTTRNKKQSRYFPKSISSKRRNEKNKISKSTSKITQNFFSKMDMFYY